MSPTVTALRVRTVHHKGMASCKVSLTINGMVASWVLSFLVTVWTRRRILQFKMVASLLILLCTSPFQINTGFSFITRPSLINGSPSSSFLCSNWTATSKKAVILFLMRNTARLANLSSKHLRETGSNFT